MLGAGCRDEGKGADTARILLSLVTMVRVLKHDHICVFKCPLRRRRGWSVSTENSWGPREAGKRPARERSDLSRGSLWGWGEAADLGGVLGGMVNRMCWWVACRVRDREEPRKHRFHAGGSS